METIKEIQEKINKIKQEIEEKNLKIQEYNKVLSELKSPKIGQLFFFHGKETACGFYVNHNIYKVIHILGDVVTIECAKTAHTRKLMMAYFTGDNNYTIEMFPAPEIAQYVNHYIYIHEMEFKVEGITDKGNKVILSHKEDIKDLRYTIRII